MPVGGDRYEKGCFHFYYIHPFNRVLNTNGETQEICQRWGFYFRTEPIRFFGRVERPDEQATWTVEGGQYQITYGLRGVEVGGRHKAFNDVWIYYKQNRILFFANHRLVSQHKWDDYQKGDREKKELPAIMK
jgi:hypothetical protein